MDNTPYVSGWEDLCACSVIPQTFQLLTVTCSNRGSSRHCPSQGKLRLNASVKKRHRLQCFKAPQPQGNAESHQNCWAELDFRLGVTCMSSYPHLLFRFPLNICASSSSRVLFHFDVLRIFLIENKKITDPLHCAGHSLVGPSYDDQLKRVFC